MIEIKKNKGKYHLFINKRVVEESIVELNEYKKEKSFYIETNNHEISKQLAFHKIKELSKAKLDSIRLSDWCKWTHFQNHVFITDLDHELENYGISFTFIPNLEQWKFPYSLTEYIYELNELFSSRNNYDGKIFPYDKEGSEWFEIEFDIGDSESILIDKITSREKFLREYHEKIINKYLDPGNINSILMFFHFPEQLKIPCQQYLLYFAQFLQDLGINATSGLKEEAGKVLFSVTPTDDVEALDKIREALAVYLSLPSSPVLYNDSFQSMQLKQQIENLQHSQRMKEMEMRSAQYALRLAQQNIENQDKIITQQNSFIDNQNKIIEKITSKSIMIDSLENKEELEKFCEGFEVGKSEFLIKHFGLHLNPATVLKNAGKKILGKGDEKKSVLGLDEETGEKEN